VAWLSVLLHHRCFAWSLLLPSIISPVVLYHNFLSFPSHHHPTTYTMIPLYLSLALFLLSIQQPSYAEPIHIPLTARSPLPNDPNFWLAAADNLRSKYNYATSNQSSTPGTNVQGKRNVAGISIVNQVCDAVYRIMRLFLKFLFLSLFLFILSSKRMPATLEPSVLAPREFFISDSSFPCFIGWLDLQRISLVMKWSLASWK
jgi:hypothetical protein